MSKGLFLAEPSPQLSERCFIYLHLQLLHDKELEVAPLGALAIWTLRYPKPASYDCRNVELTVKQ